MVSFQDMLQACKLEKVEEITGTEVQEGEVEPEGEVLVGPEGEVLRPSSIIMVYSPTLFMTLFLKVSGHQIPDNKKRH